jgi:hypothetical protein
MSNDYLSLIISNIDMINVLVLSRHYNKSAVTGFDCDWKCAILCKRNKLIRTELFRYAFWSLLKVFDRFCNDVTKDVTTFLARFASACPRLGLVLLY